MTRELPSHAGRHCENGKSCCNMPLHNCLLMTSDRLIGIIGKIVRQTVFPADIPLAGSTGPDRRMTLWGLS